jgi:hypothetical protein
MYICGMNKFQNFAHLFSFWIFLWFFLYYFGYFTEYNPKLALTVGMAFEIFLIILMFFNDVSIRYILIFFLLQIFIKVIPLYILRNKPIDLIPDLKSTIIVFFIYFAFLYWNDVNVIDFNKKAFYNFAHGIPNSPFMDLLDSAIYK